MNYVIEGEYLLVPLKEDLDAAYLASLVEVLPEVVYRRRIRGVIVDFSALRFIDGYAARMVKKVAGMVSLLGAVTVLCGMKPGVAASLVDLGFDMEGIPVASDKREAQSLVERTRR